MKNYLLPIFFLASISLFAQNRFGFTYTGIYKIIENGDSLKMPWAGGLNQPQFNTVDINLDGTDDLVVFDRTGNRILPFLRVTVNGQDRYRYAPQYRSNFPPIAHWMLLKDYDCDGKKDLFCSVNAGIGVYKNVSDTALKFAWALSGQYLPSNFFGQPANLKVLTTDIPGLIDIDYDGDLDIFTFGQAGSSLEFHENQTACGLDFLLKSWCWGRFVENQISNKIEINACPPTVPRIGINAPPLDNLNKVQHAGSTSLMLDLDGDSLYDALIGDISYPNANAVFNKGSLDSAVVTTVDSLFPVFNAPIDVFIFPAMFYEDVTFDGVPDLLAAPNAELGSKTTNNVWLYTNNGSTQNPNFSRTDTSFLQRDMIDLGEGAVPVLADLNTDGLADLVVANFGQLQKNANYKSLLRYYKNTGSQNNPKFELIESDLSGISQLNLGNNLIPAFGDLDGDIDLDLILGATDGKLYYFENTGNFLSPTFSLTTGNYQGIDVGGSSAPHLFDIDDDGDLDLFIGNEQGTIHFYENDGNQPPTFSLVSNNFGGVNVKSKFFNQGFSVPWFIKRNDTLSLFVGSQDNGILQFDSILSVLDKPATIIQQIGSGSTPSNNVNTTPFGASKRNGRNQILYRASDLRAAGFTYGKITGIAFEIPNFPGNIISQGFTVKMKHVNQQTLNGWDTNFTVVFDFIYGFGSGWNNITLSTPFLWDGDSDLLVEICFSKNFQSNDLHVTCTDVGYPVNAYGDVANWNGVTNDGCEMPYLGTSSLRPNIQLTLIPTFVQTDVVMQDGYRNAAAIADLNGDQYLDAIMGNYCGGITFYKGVEWVANPFDVEEPEFTTNQLMVYPNPTAYNITVEVPMHLEQEVCTVNLLDLTGSVVAQSTTTGKRTELDVAQLKNGIYFVLIQHKNEVYHSRFVINR